MPKDRTNPLLRRSTSSPFSTAQRTKPLSRSSSTSTDASQPLPDTGLLPSLAPKHTPQTVSALLDHARAHFFDPIPDRAPGMNSERISQLLRFRKALPPITSAARLHAISSSSTATERELACLIVAGEVRRITIPGRGRGGAAVGDGIVRVCDWVAGIGAEESLDGKLKEKYVAALRSHPASATVPASTFTVGEERALVSTGFLTSPTALSTTLGDPFAAASSVSLSSVAAAGSRFATGSLAAIGGAGAVHESGGSGSTLATQSSRTVPSNSREVGRHMTFALPGTGAYLKLLVAARQHLLHILKSLSPKYREATVELLREKWEGNVLGSDEGSLGAKKKARGEWTGVLPGKTKKWRDFGGMGFRGVLEECVGAGLVEVFDSGSVGMAVRGR